MNESAQETAQPREPVDPDSGTHGGSLDLDRVNPLQQAILERARRDEERGRWWPEMTRAQWVVSAIVAAIMATAIFRVVDGGLEAFQRFAEAMATPPPEAAAPEPPPVDVSIPYSVILVPEEAPPRPPSAPPPP